MAKWEDDDYKYKHVVDHEKGRVTVDKIGKTGKDHEHSWSDSRNHKSGWRGKDHNKSKGGGGSGGKCFITTACIRSHGLDDDCYELNILRSFRDSHLSQSETGAQAILEYYKISPLIVREISKLESAHDQFRKIYRELVQPAVRLVETQRYEEAFLFYRREVKRLERLHLADSDSEEKR